MKLCTRAAIAASLLTAGAASATTIDMDWTVIGNAGNFANPRSNFGAVDYEFRMSTYEVTNAQYAAFLNSVASTSDAHGLYNEMMGISSRGGIARSGAPGAYTYTIRPSMGNKPVNFVSWLDAARMANWMTNGQGSGDTESGVYTISSSGGFFNPLTVTIDRDPSNPSQVFLPTEDEWHKGAYHQPGGNVNGYSMYATGNDFVPWPASVNSTGDVIGGRPLGDGGIPPGNHIVNFNTAAIWNGAPGNVATVGTAITDNFYGLADMNGNVAEWLETPVQTTFGVNRPLAGGSWASSELTLRDTERFTQVPSAESDRSGFRFAAPIIPTPGGAALLAIGAPLLARRRR